MALGLNELALTPVPAGILVSIVMPAFNARGFIGNAIATVQRQTEQNFEILVADDASTDDTASIVTAMAEADPRIRLIRLPRNAGQGAARNAAINAASGTWIALLDADDAFAPSRLAHLLSLAERHRADIVSDNLALCSGQDGEPHGIMFSSARIAGEMRLTAAAFIRENTGQPAGQRTAFGFMHPMFRRQFLEDHGLRYNDHCRFGEDYMLYVQCLLAGANWWITPAPLYLYRVCSGTVSDIVSCDDLKTISAMEQDILDNEAYAKDASLLREVRKHRRGVDHWRYTTEYRSCMERRKVGRALRVMCQNSLSLRAITRDIAARSALRRFLFGVKRRSR